ncbi:YfhO family protein [Ruminococcaceae bacterium OttesenSCG-928-I18]|nr:YfhO family protein [Ruminococcaceae bacterium OttesenSCG-928-I18]
MSLSDGREAAPLRLARRHPALAAALLAAAMMLLCYLLLGIWPFGGATVLTGDLNMQYVPYFSHFQRFFAGDAGFAYGFDKSLGGGLLGLFAYYVSSPLNLLYLSFPVRLFPVVSGFLLLLKVVLASSFMALFLAKKFPGLGLLGLVPALGYGFSAFVFVYAQNIMWHDVLLLMPLLCLGVDRLLTGGGNLPYAGVLALCIFVNFYIAYMACLYLVLYFAASLAMQPAAQRKVRRSVLSFAGGSLLGGGLSAALLLPALFNLSGSKGDLLAFDFSFETKFPLWQLPEKLAFNSFLWEDVIDGLPLLYCGLLLPLLALCFFLSRKVALRAKLLAGGVLTVLILSFWVGGFDTFWHGLKEPVWFPYRYSWLFCFTLALLATAALARGAVGKKEALLSGGALAVVFLLLSLLSAAGTVKLLASAAGVAGFAVLLWAYQKRAPGTGRKVLAGVVLGAVCLELVLNAVLITRKFENYPLADYQDFVDRVGGVLQPAGQAGGRVEKNFYRTLNDPMLLDYDGVSHFGSTQDNAATDTLWNLGYRGNGSYLYGSTAFADSVLGLRTLLSDGGRPVPAHWRAAGQTEGGTLYENPYALPLFFTLPVGGERQGEGEAPLWEDSFAYQNELYNRLGAEGPLFEQVADVRLVTGEQESTGLTGTLPPGAEYLLRAEGEGYYYALPVAANPLYDLGVLLDGKPCGQGFTADQNGVYNLGYLEAGQQVRLGWDNEAPIEMNAIYFACLPAQKLEALADTARESGGEFTREDGRVWGTVQAQEGQVLFASIPYDEDWRAVVNGKESEPFRLAGGFLGLPLEEGENEIELRYSPGGAAAGWVVTAVSAVLFAGLLVRGLTRRRRQNESIETGR